MRLQPYDTNKQKIESISTYKKMWYECQWVNSPSKSQFIKVNHYRLKYGLQHRALAHTAQQGIKSPKSYQCKTIQTGKPTV